MAAVDPINISSDSDDLFEDDDFDTSPIRRSTESRVLPSWATTAGMDHRSFFYTSRYFFFLFFQYLAPTSDVILFLVGHVVGRTFPG